MLRVDHPLILMENELPGLRTQRNVPVHDGINFEISCIGSSARVCCACFSTAKLAKVSVGVFAIAIWRGADRAGTGTAGRVPLSGS